MPKIPTALTLFVLSCAGLLSWSPVSAEPYLAVFEGLQCSACHSHPSGGGRRNAFGNVYAQNVLAARTLGGDAAPWTGEVSRWLAVGANLRGGYAYTDTPGSPSHNAFDITRGTVYVEATLVPERLSVYVDQQIAPDAAINREAYVRLASEGRRYQLVAGQFYLPYGLRLQDDGAFIRQVTGINLATPDRGIQFLYEAGALSAQLAVTNGSGGGPETDSGKQVTGVVQFVQPGWRAGASASVNNADGGDRRMANLFGGIRTGPLAWLAEADWLRDELPGRADRDGIAALLEANWRYRKGHNLKLSYDYYDPDRDIDEDHEVRYSLVWEYSPLQFLQTRLGARRYDGPPQLPLTNRDEWFAELHGFF